jgi:hypothetical protein
MWNDRPYSRQNCDGDYVISAAVTLYLWWHSVCKTVSKNYRYEVTVTVLITTQLNKRLIISCFFSSAANVWKLKKPSLLTICYKRWIQPVFVVVANFEAIRYSAIAPCLLQHLFKLSATSTYSTYLVGFRRDEFYPRKHRLYPAHTLALGKYMCHCPELPHRLYDNRFWISETSNSFLNSTFTASCAPLRWAHELLLQWLQSFCLKDLLSLAN